MSEHGQGAIGLAQRPCRWDNESLTQWCRGAALTAPGVDTKGCGFHVG